MAKLVFMDGDKTFEEKINDLAISILIFLAGLLLVFLSIVLIPIFLSVPNKYCVLNSIGTVLILLSLYLMLGNTYLKSIFASGRAVFTFAFLCSLSA